MSENQQIAIVEPVLAPADVFQSLTNGYGFDNFKTTVEKYINQQRTIVADINTAAGRAAIISAAAAVKSCKTSLNKVALEQARVFVILEQERILEGKPKEIRANLKIIEQMLDDGAESICKLVTDFEQPRKEAAEKAETERLENERKAAEAKEAQARLDAEKAEAARVANQEHRTKIENDIYKIFNSFLDVTGGLDEGYNVGGIDELIAAIAAGRIPHVSINY